MIAANLATYPPRFKTLLNVLKTLSPQVDVINLVLNEYESVPELISQFENVNPVIPMHDTKDAGKFYTDVMEMEYVLLVDDDISYPPDYADKTITRFNYFCQDSGLGGYHGSIYQKPSFPQGVRILKRFIKYYARPSLVARYRKVFPYYSNVKDAFHVDQIGTGTGVMRGADIPPYNFMKTSQKFVDVRLANWCFKCGMTKICLPRTKDWMSSPDELMNSVDETICESFTRKMPAHVSTEIREFAFKNSCVGDYIMNGVQ